MSLFLSLSRCLVVSSAIDFPPRPAAAAGPKRLHQAGAGPRRLVGVLDREPVLGHAQTDGLAVDVRDLVGAHVAVGAGQPRPVDLQVAGAPEAAAEGLR